MTSNDSFIILDHGSGGRLSQNLISSLFLKHFNTGKPTFPTDSALLLKTNSNLAFSTDGYVVAPYFFPGGNIGKLAVCGTVNDLAVVGAIPAYLSCGFIIEEGFPIKDLEIIVATMAKEAKLAKIKIVTGDTKVVEKGACDHIFITTSGIGKMRPDCKHIATAQRLKAGDKILINGPMGDHGLAVMTARHELPFSTPITSDCASLNGLINTVLRTSSTVHFMRDATRGGLATVLCEVAEGRSIGIHLNEQAIPINEPVRGLCEILGFDPLYVANEGKVVIIVAEKDATAVLAAMKKHDLGKNSAIIGEVTADHVGKVIMKTQIGGSRIVDMLTGAQLPRIC